MDTVTTDPASGALVVTHDYGDDIPVAVVINCAPPAQTELDAVAAIEEGITLVRTGNLAAGQAKIAEAQQQLQDTSAARVQVAPFTDEQIAQQQADAASAAAAAAEAAAADEARQALVGKLTSGSATTDEIQQALAALLAGTATAA